MGKESKELKRVGKLIGKVDKTLLELDNIAKLPDNQQAKFFIKTGKLFIKVGKALKKDKL